MMKVMQKREIPKADNSQYNLETTKFLLLKQLVVMLPEGLLAKYNF